MILIIGNNFYQAHGRDHEAEVATVLLLVVQVTHEPRLNSIMILIIGNNLYQAHGRDHEAD